jgi:hypothetical protein
VGGGMSVGQGGGGASSITRLVSQTGTLSEEIDIKVVAGCTRNYLSKLTKKLSEKYLQKCCKILGIIVTLNFSSKAFKKFSIYRISFSKFS